MEENNINEVKVVSVVDGDNMRLETELWVELPVEAANYLNHREACQAWRCTKSWCMSWGMKFP